MKKTKFAIIGNPISHSLSPTMHNYWFKKYKINAEYELLNIDKSQIENVINNLPDLDEWYGPEIIKKFGFSSWKKSIQMVHSAKNNKYNSTYLKRLALDEILSNLLVLSKNRKKFKKLLRRQYEKQSTN